MRSTFIHSRSSLENHTRFQTKMVSVYPFSDQNGAKPLPDWGGGGGGAHISMAYIKEYPRDKKLFQARCIFLKRQQIA